MLLSELINELEELKESMGDIPVFINDESDVRNAPFLYGSVYSNENYCSSARDIEWKPCVMIVGVECGFD